MNATIDRPTLRGVLHTYAAVAAVVAGGVLVAIAGSPRARFAVLIFAVSHVVQLTVSAVYHRVTWSNDARALMRRADHGMVFVLIAGSATPFALLSMPADLGTKLLVLFWTGAAVGTALTIFWAKKPRWLMAVLCIGLGWAGAPWWLDERGTLGMTTVALLASSGVLYSVGAIIYAMKWPNFAPRTFGHHELFHALTIIAAIVNFGAVARIVMLENAA